MEIPPISRGDKNDSSLTRSSPAPPPPYFHISSGAPSTPVFVKPLELWLDARGADAEDDGTDWKKFQELADVVLCDEFTSGDFGAPPKR